MNGADSPGPLGDRTELLGAVHLHTSHSDGGSSVAEIAAAAAACGLDFVVTADHDTLGARESGHERWHGRVLAAVGVEITARRNCHLLALGGATAPPSGELDVPEVLEAVRGEGGFCLAAHPQNQGVHYRRDPLRRWPHWDHPLLDGLEAWSYLQDWATRVRLWRPSSWRLENVAALVAGPPDWVLERWDAQAERRPFAGLAASDNHDKRLPLTGLRLFPHEAMLGRLVNRVRLDAPLPADGAAAARRLFAALAGGRALIAREELAPSDGFDFHAETPDGRRLLPGDSAAFASGTRLTAVSPLRAELRVCRLGRPEAATTGLRIEHRPAGPGAYRAEARLDGKAWAFSNHVRLL